MLLQMALQVLPDLRSVVTIAAKQIFPENFLRWKLINLVGSKLLLFRNQWTIAIFSQYIVDVVLQLSLCHVLRANHHQIVVDVPLLRMQIRQDHVRALVIVLHVDDHHL